MTDPLVSVLFPIRNEEAFLERSLGAIVEQDYPNLEILVIDGASTDHTVEIVQAFQQRDPRIRLLHNPAQWQSRSLNIGVQAAQGEILVRVDGHAIIAPDYVRQVVGVFNTVDTDSVGGKQVAVGTSPMGKAIALSYGSRFGVPSHFRVLNQDTFTDTAYMGAWRREILDRVGGWREDYRVQEDYEHFYRIRQAGGKVYLSMHLQSEYHCRDTWQALWTQYYRYGRGKVKMLRDHPDSLRWRQAVAPLFVLALIGGALLGLFFPPIGYLWVVMIALYLAVNFAVSINLVNNNLSLLWRLMLVFATIHIAWGLGFWLEVIAGG